LRNYATQVAARVKRKKPAFEASAADKYDKAAGAGKAFIAAVVRDLGHGDIDALIKDYGKDVQAKHEEFIECVRQQRGEVSSPWLVGAAQALYVVAKDIWRDADAANAVKRKELVEKLQKLQWTYYADLNSGAPAATTQTVR
jgi:hypothetical protein